MQPLDKTYCNLWIWFHFQNTDEKSGKLTMFLVIVSLEWIQLNKTQYMLNAIKGLLQRKPEHKWWKKKFYQVLILTKHNDGQILEHSNHKSYKKREKICHYKWVTESCTFDPEFVCMPCNMWMVNIRDKITVISQHLGKETDCQYSHITTTTTLMHL